MALVEVIRWDSSKDVYAHKHAETDLGTWTQLIVQETQEAMLMKEGQYFGPFTPGRHTLSTKNFPLLEKFVNIPFGGKSPFTAEVWYVNRAIALDLKWGTSPPIQLQDPRFNVMLPVRAFGQFGIQITETEKFLSKLVGTLSVFNEATLREYFSGVVLSRLRDVVSTYIVKQEISILDINTQLTEISLQLEKELGEEFAEFGMGLHKFRVMSINTPEDDPAVVRLKEALSKKAEMDIIGYNYQQERSFDVMEAAAQNEGAGGSIMGAGIGAGMGVGMGVGMAGQVGNMMGQVNTDTPPQAPGTPPAFGGAQGAQYFVHLDGQQAGPYPMATLKQGAESGQFTAETPVWRQGMDGWKPAGEVSDLQALFGPAQPPPFPDKS